MALPIAHRIRHHWRTIIKPSLSGVSVILVDGEDRVLMVRHSYGPPTWALPGGGIDRKEAPIDCAKRELHEELGVHGCELQFVGTLEETLSGAPHSAFIFQGRCPVAPKPDRREILEAQFFPVHSLPHPLSDATRRRLAFWTDKGRR